MRIAYICYWGINDVLTISSVLPTLEYLTSREDVKNIDLYTFERDDTNIEITYDLHPKISLCQTKEGGKISIIAKIKAFRNTIKKLKYANSLRQYDWCIGRSVFAGIAAYYLNQKFDVPFVVESFEPHTDYMVDTGSWGNNSIKTKVLRYYHKQVVRKASVLIPVSENYREQLLLNSDVDPNKLKVLPCTVDTGSFSYSIDDRKTRRRELRLDEKDVVGVYVGKFGDIYYSEEAFECFNEVLSTFENSKLVILSSTPIEKIEKMANSVGFDFSKIIYRFVKNHEVPSYLSASDFAFATIRQFPSSRFSSAIKIGEYWANGLPVVISKGVGDDSKLIEENTLGFVYDFTQTSSNIQHISQLINPMSRERIMHFGREKRGRHLISEVYDLILR